jgi:hypothetical protein
LFEGIIYCFFYAERRNVMAKLLMGMCVLLAAAVLALNASAGKVVYSGTHGYERISKGVFDLGLDNILLVSYISTTQPPATTGDTPSKFSSLSATYIGGLTPRFFLVDNFALGLSLNLFYGKNKVTDAAGDEDSSSDLGFIGFVMLNYNLRLGHSLFFKPGVGIGAFYGKRQYPTEDPAYKRESSLYGGAGRIDLGFVFYAGPHVNLRAGPDIIIRVGKEDPPDGEAESFMSVDAGFTIGIGASF